MIQLPRGTKDLFNIEIENWHYVEKILFDTCQKFNVQELRTPIFEHTELYNRGMGNETDVVQKEMYTFEDKGKRSLTLKPEGTAGIVRAFIQNKFYANPFPVKLFYNSPMFRYERPQLGRMRQFHQFGVEYFGIAESSCDAEIISLACSILKNLGLDNFNLKINSLGCTECRTNYNKILRDYIKSNLTSLCDECRKRFEINPLRILDCKNADCRKILEDAPSILETLCDDCSNHFETLQRFLLNIGINFEVDEKIVRGLDYYTRTVFELICDTDGLGTQNAICGGGRYDTLVENLGGPKQTPAIGFAFGMERLILALQNQNKLPNKLQIPDIFIGFMGEKGFAKAQSITANLRRTMNVEMCLVEKSAKAQLKYANKISARFVTIIGDQEIDEQVIKIKNMSSGEEQLVNINQIEKFFIDFKEEN